MSYSANFKLRVAAYAIEHGNNSKAAREFGVSEMVFGSTYI